MEVKSLVGYGVSSDSDSDSEEGENTQTENETKAGVEKKTRNFLLESGSASSESSSESEQEEAAEAVCPGGLDSSSEVLLPPPLSPSLHKLPPPSLGHSNSGGVPVGSSVFTNPFKKRAEERLSALQKHVPLTQHARPTQIDGKRMCVAYRKDGRCRFGIRCKYAHDSDLPSSVIQPCNTASENGPVDQTEHNAPPSHTSGVERNEEEEESHKRKKHRVGLSDTLIPPKRAMKQYALQKHSH